MWPFSSYPEVSCQDLNAEYDYIIIGGGTAGCALANRLSADSSVTVLVVEAGRVNDNWASRVPLISADFVANRAGTYNRVSVPQSSLGGRELHLYTGKALGGTSRINAMLYTRGSAGEYDEMSAGGRKGWAFEDVEPIFKSAECFHGKVVGPERGEAGEWKVRSHELKYFMPTQRLAEAAQKIGLPHIDDINSSSSPVLGVAKCQYTLDQNSHRHSAYTAFLPEDLVKSRRTHLTICTDTAATKLHIKSGPDGVPKVEGVHLRCASKKTIYAYVAAIREVILCAGPLANPQILQLSGIGPRDLLEKHNIPVIKELPGVGSCLQDHQGCPISFHVPIKDSIIILEKSPLAAIKELLRYITRGEGLFLLPIQERLVLARSDLIDEHGYIHATPEQLDGRKPENIPDIELIPLAYEGADELPTNKSEGIYSVLCALLRPKSTGSVRITSTDPDVPPACDPGFLTHPDDMETMRRALRLAMRITAEMRDAGYEMKPFRVPEGKEEDWDGYIRRWTRSTYHFSSTCRMAPEDDAEFPGVVDDTLRVHGVKSLRVADSSVFPRVPAAHTQAPAVMVGMKCAEMIKEAWNQ